MKKLLSKNAILGSFLILSLTNCARDLKITLDYCLVEPVRLSEKAKKVVSKTNRQNIVDNNKLYYCNCDSIKIPKEFKKECRK
jgi:hypothetical protein